MKNTNQTSQIMKRIICLAAGLLALNLTPVFGQPSDDAKLKILAAQAEATAKQSLTKFNLDFPGGTPAELVQAIEKAMGKPLNAIIPMEDAEIQLPPLKMNDVNVVQLFQALGAASLKQETRNTPMYFVGSNPGFNYTTVNTGYGFKTEGQVSDDSIWYFYVENPPQPQLTPPAPAKSCRFYQLRPYLDSGLTVDDITTAIQTGWKMMGDTSPPQISFHKETKLLIAVGEPDKLEVIENVLNALRPPSPNPNETFQSRMQEILKNAAPAGTQPRLYAPPLPPAPLSPPNMPASTNSPAEKSGK